MEPAVRDEDYMTESVRHVADLLRVRNVVDEAIARIINRPVASGHLGEWLASEIFGIDLAPTAVNRGFDGRFRSGELAGQTVDIKWYLKREGVLDINVTVSPDYYLVMTGPTAAASSSLGARRPGCVEAVYLFETTNLLAEQMGRGVALGVASSVRNAQWTAAEVYPCRNDALLNVTDEQRALLELFRLKESGT
jgi:hypothetical protein